MRRYIVRNLRVSPEATPEECRAALAKKLGTWDFEAQLYRESIDARRGIQRNLQFLVQLKGRGRLPRHSDIQPYEALELERPKGHVPLRRRPVIVGSGPCGLFAAWLLAQEGYCPLILERGAPVEERRRDVERFWQEGLLKAESNVQFGEGGAGTFSDGKLTSRSKDPRVHSVLESLVALGAPEDILWRQYPHVGTDQLQALLPRLRAQIEAWGGEFRFHCRFLSCIVEGGRLKGLRSTQGDLDTDVLILALGHSARDSFYQLHQDGLAMEAKAFAMGFRLEHPQVQIERQQYGTNYAESPLLPRASYHLTAQVQGGLKALGVYSFCMCPGGYVVNASSEPQRLCVNGMSYRARDGRNANAALLCTVDRDIYGAELFSGLEFQRQVEARAFALGQEAGAYAAPVQCWADYRKNVASSQLGEIQPSVRPSWQLSNLRGLYPPAMEEAFIQALELWGQRLPNFDRGDAILTGVEARSSSPLRLLRNTEGESLSLPGLFPAGEGAGYAGGIVSAAIDGLKAAQQIMQRYAPLCRPFVQV